jgi:hypothetical protein
VRKLRKQDGRNANMETEWEEYDDETIPEDADQDDEEEEEKGEDGQAVPDAQISKYQQRGRNGEYTWEADRVAARNVYRIKKKIVSMAEDGNLAAAKLVFELWKEQKKSKRVRGNATKEISLGFAKEQ